MRTQTQTKVWFAKEEKGERTNMLSYLYFGVPEVCRQIKLTSFLNTLASRNGKNYAQMKNILMYKLLGTWMSQLYCGSLYTSVTGMI